MQSIERIRASDGSGNASVATIQSSRSPGATTISVDTVLSINSDGFIGSMGTPHTFIDPITSEEITVISEASCVDFSGHVDGSNLEIDSIAPGYTDGGSQVGDIVIIRPTTQYANNLADVLATSLNDDGSVNPAGIHQATPAGVVLPYAGASAPTGFLLCNGASLLRTDFAALFSAIGTVFGSADGTHFNVPDMRGRQPMGVGTRSWALTFASTDVNTTTDQIAIAANKNVYTGKAVVITGTGTVPTGLTASTTYYVIVVDSTHIKLATNLVNAIAGTAIDITAQGSGTNTLTFTATAKALAEQGGEESHALVVAETPSHNHSLNKAGTAGGDGSGMAFSSTSVNNATGVGNTGGSTEHNILGPYVGLNFIIKV